MKKEPDTLIQYWENLSEADIAIIYASMRTRGRDNPGVLPFTPMKIVCEALRFVATVAEKKRPMLRLLHKLEAHKWEVEHPRLLDLYPINQKRVQKLLPLHKRTPVSLSSKMFTFRLPWDQKTRATVLPDTNIWSINVAPKHRAALAAWLDGVTLGPPPKKRKRRQR